jgi:hypothetical protein
MSPPAARWRFTLATVRQLRLVVYIAVALTVGPVVRFLGVVLATLASGNVGTFVVAVVVGLGIESGRTLFALTGDDTASVVDSDVRARSRRWLATSALVGAAVTVGVLLRREQGVALWVGSFVVGLVVLAVGAGLRSEGSVDGRAGVPTYDGGTIPLDARRDVDSIRMGRFVLALVA